MCEVDHFREGGAKGWHVCCGVEEWWVLFDEQVLHFPAAILGRLVLGWSMLWGFYLRHVDELFLCASQRVDDGWQACFWAVGHVKGKGLDVSAYSRQRINTRRLGEGRRLKRHGHLFEQPGCSFGRKIMAHEAKVGEVLRFHVVKHGVAACII